MNQANHFAPAEAGLVIAVLLALSLAGCGKSQKEQELERADQRARDRESILRYEADAALILATQQAKIEKERAAQDSARTARSDQLDTAALQESLKSVLVSRLKDPGSVQFSKLKMNSQKSALCGEYNAKNGFGGYSGLKPFIVTSDRKLMILDNNSTSFDGAYSSVEYLAAMSNRVCD